MKQQKTSKKLKEQQELLNIKIEGAPNSDGEEDSEDEQEKETEKETTKMGGFGIGKKE